MVEKKAPLFSLM